jgi:Fungal N-terminal domain of STAND proteins
MDPFTALGVACNVIDLVSTAISCGLAVRDIYKSVDGRTKANAALQNEADGMNAVVKSLREKDSEIKMLTDDGDIQKTVSRCAAEAEQLQLVLEDCRAKSKTAGGVFIALFKSSINSGKIDDLQKRLVACKDDLKLSLALATR